MSSDPVVAKFNFSQEQSAELGDLVLSFLAKHFTEEVLSSMEVDVEVRFSPRAEEMNVLKSAEIDTAGKTAERKSLKVLASVAGGSCVIGTPAHPFCPTGRTWK